METELIHRILQFCRMEMADGNMTVDRYFKLVDGDVPVMVDFYADWCEPCVMLDEILAELKSRMERLRIIKVDIDQQPELVSHFGFRSVPWLILYNKGKEVWRMNGFMMTSDLKKIIKQYCEP